MKFTTLLLFAFLFSSISSVANDLRISKVQFNNKKAVVSFNLSWKNSWKNKKNYDAAWVFVKIIDASGKTFHGKLQNSKHRIKGIQKGSIDISKDRVGAFVKLSEYYRGNVTWEVRLALDKSALPKSNKSFTVKVFGLEMVYIPKGNFYLGATETKAVNYASFYESDATGNPVNPFLINSENQEIKVSPTQGNLFYKIGKSPYRGDAKGTIPSTFPKGHAAFYIMKYETSQGFYADFLNSIPKNLAYRLSPHTVKDYYKKKGGIRFSNTIYKADTYNRPANFITWDDGAVLADWAGLRPMTELEFTKAARGTNRPIEHEFPWGTNTAKNLKRKVETNDELLFTEGILEKNLNDTNRELYGASYYWVMDLAGSLWEKCVTVGHPIGRNFRGTHGDGILSSDGYSTNADWPKGIKEEGGYGYRGGGYYHHGMKVGDYNPHSPISYRPYGSWSGGKKSIAYSQRYVRSAE